MVYIIPKKLKEETKLFSFAHGTFAIYLKDVAVLGIWAGGILTLRPYVHPWLMVPYILFGILSGLYLILPARYTNPGKRNWEALLLCLGADTGVFYSLKGRVLYESKESK